MPENINSLLALPVETLAMLVAGYLGYRLAYTGKDEAHRGVDVVFLSLAFGLAARAVMAAVETLEWGPWAGIGLGVLAALLAAAGWRRWGQEATFRGLRAAKVSMADGHRTALQSVVKRESVAISQIYVQRRNGNDMLCDNVAAFEETATGPFWFGEDGSIALYVTHLRQKDSDDWEACDDVRHKGSGDLIRIIPADDVAMVEIRNQKQ